jgi:integrase
MGTAENATAREPWNKGKIVGQKAPFKLKEIWALRVRLQMESRIRELALFNLGVDSKLRGCDLVALKVRDVCHGDQMATRAIVMQHKTQRPVQFEITQATRDALQAWIKQAGLKQEDFLFPSRFHDSPHLGTRQYARILGHWVDELGLDRADYGTHSMRRTKATLIYRRTKNLRAVQLLLGHSKLDYLPRRTMSRGPFDHLWRANRTAGHRRPRYKPFRKASNWSSGRYRPGLPSGGVVLLRTACFIAKSASR